jgi:hypothetical protein
LIHIPSFAPAQSLLSLRIPWHREVDLFEKAVLLSPGALVGSIATTPTPISTPIASTGATTPTAATESTPSTTAGHSRDVGALRSDLYGEKKKSILVL